LKNVEYKCEFIFIFLCLYFNNKFIRENEHLNKNQQSDDLTLFKIKIINYL